MKPISLSTYVVSITLWLSLWMGATAIVVERNISEAEKDLKQYGDAYSDHLNKKMASNIAILKGFSALFGTIGTAAPARVARYVSQVIESNPQIFALEVVQAVTKNQLVEFIAGKRRDGMPKFTIKSYSYDLERKWQEVPEKPTYYPIVFIEPKSSGVEDILGLDVGSVPFLQRALSASLQRGAPVASRPFRLVEGNLAYVVFCPVLRSEVPPLARSNLPDKMVVDMVVDAAGLTEPIKFPVFDGGAVRIYHKDFSPDDTKGQLLAMQGKARSPIETALFPTFVYQKSLATMGEPFTLMIKRQVGWSDLNLGLLALLGVLTLMSSLMLVAYLWVQQQGRGMQIENQKRLWQLANHDALTGLPNRMLLLDRLEQLLARMLRQEKHLAIMFLDLDDFKQVNDTYGHEVGDQLLKLVAERLRAAVRVDDTVARLCGDEFIILIEGVENREAQEAIGQKIQQNLSEGFLIEGQLFRVRTSIGIATFPEDGDSPEALLKQADMRMYADKRARSAKHHVV